MFQGYWQTTIGFELKGKMLGLIGLGKIGTQVAKVAKAFGMEVCAWSENLNLTHANEIGVLPMSKEDLLKNSDIVSIHLVLGDRYKHLITIKEIESQTGANLEIVGTNPNFKVRIEGKGP